MAGKSLRFCMKCSTTHDNGEKCPKAQPTWSHQQLSDYRSNAWKFNAKHQRREVVRKDNAALSRKNKQILLKNEPFCACCGNDEAALELDHITNLAQGGGFELDNCQLLCAVCHGLKTKKERKIGQKWRESKHMKPKSGPMVEKYH